MFRSFDSCALTPLAFDLKIVDGGRSSVIALVQPQTLLIMRRHILIAGILSLLSLFDLKIVDGAWSSVIDDFVSTTTCNDLDDLEQRHSQYLETLRAEILMSKKVRGGVTFHPTLT